MSLKLKLLTKGKSSYVAASIFIGGLNELNNLCCEMFNSIFSVTVLSRSPLWSSYRAGSDVFSCDAKEAFKGSSLIVAIIFTVE
jgi:hypothetical protein